MGMVLGDNDHHDLLLCQRLAVEFSYLNGKLQSDSQIFPVRKESFPVGRKDSTKQWKLVWPDRKLY